MMAALVFGWRLFRALLTLACLVAFGVFVGYVLPLLLGFGG